MGNVQSTVQGEQDANSIMNNLPVFGNAFKLQTTASDALGNALNGVSGMVSNPIFMYGAAAVVLIVLIK